MVLRCGGGAAALPTAWRVQGSVRSGPSLLLQTHSHTHTLTLTLTLSPQRTQMWERSTSTFQVLATGRRPEPPSRDARTRDTHRQTRQTLQKPLHSTPPQPQRPAKHPRRCKIRGWVCSNPLLVWSVDPLFSGGARKSFVWSLERLDRASLHSLALFLGSRLLSDEWDRSYRPSALAPGYR